MGSSRRHLPNIVLHCTEGPRGVGENLNCPYFGHFLSNGANFFSNALVLTIFLGSGGICKKILHFDVSRGLRSKKKNNFEPFYIALGGHHSKIIYKCTKPYLGCEFELQS